MESPTIWVCSADAQTSALICINLTRRGYSPIDSYTSLPGRASAPPALVIFDLGNSVTLHSLSTYLRGGRNTPMILLVDSPPSAGQIEPLKPVRWLEKPLSMDRLVECVREMAG
jgi:hypothetical protein